MMKRFLTSCLITFAAALVSANSQRPQDFLTDDDLHTFVSRPDLRPPTFSVVTYNASSLNSGYWFVAPYTDLHDRPPSTLYSPGQTGPHIYDGQGNLIWSGAHLFGARPTFDFKVASVNGSKYLTFIVNEDMHRSNYRGGAGIVLDSSYQVRQTIQETTGRGTFNMHEFTVTEDNTALMITYSSQLADVLVGNSKVSGWLGNNGFREADLATSRTVFEWWALDHLDPSESRVARPALPGAYANPWDLFHINSVDKNQDGDYLISARYTDAVYKISGADGSVLWRLGGSRSSFELDFTFSRQHDARFLQENSTTTIISLFNNAADDVSASATTSSALIIALDTVSMKATLLKSWARPDHALTHLRGNAQTLPNNNVFVGWSENALLSEFSPAGDCLMEAQFASHRFDTYRAYKFDFVGTPSEPPALKAIAYGPSPNSSTTAFYVSWNGATEVVAWRFYAADNWRDELKPVASMAKQGFESVVMVKDYMTRAYAEAIAADGTVLGRSELCLTVTPEAWKAQAHDEGAQRPTADTTSVANEGAGDLLAGVAADSEAGELLEPHEMSENMSTARGDIIFTLSFTKEGLVAGLVLMGVLCCFIMILAWRTYSFRRRSSPYLETAYAPLNKW